LAYEGRDEQPPDDGPVGSVADERGGLEEDLRVQRSEEELRAGVREREAGQVNVKKSVRTEREVVRVPRRREEVDIERVPVEGEARETSTATEADIGEDEWSCRSSRRRSWSPSASC
jgi:stress response protein YsnF